MALSHLCTRTTNIRWIEAKDFTGLVGPRRNGAHNTSKIRRCAEAASEVKTQQRNEEGKAAEAFTTIMSVPQETSTRWSFHKQCGRLTVKHEQQ